MTAPKTPSLEYLRETSQRGKLELSESKLKEYQEILGEYMEKYKRLEEMQLKVPEQKYPRTQGYRPQPQDNPYNAWWYKTDIQGAPEGKLKGKRVAIKDCVFVAGVPLINGSHLMSGFIPDQDATIITRILDAGGHIVGKTNCENLCFSGSSLTCWSGPVLNPVNKSRSAGGSSSGSGVVLALGEADMAIGGDQGGSIRIPACWCGVVGLKPTYGLVPYTGVMAIEGSIDHVGPMARTVKDCALLLEVLAGRDGLDYRQPSQLNVPEYSKMLDGGISNLKIGIVSEGMANCNDDVVALVRSACGHCESLGATVEEVSVPEHVDLAILWFSKAMEGGYKTMMRDAGAIQSVKGLQSEACTEHLARALASRPRDLPDSLNILYLFGNFMEEHYGNRFYLKSTNLLPQYMKGYDDALEKYDVLVMPTLPYKAPKFPENNCSVKEFADHAFGMLQNTTPFDITGHPALSLNVGQSEGLPVGMQIVGKHFGEKTILQVAHALEQKLAKK